MAAIARSNGTRASVLHALFTSGRFDPQGDPRQPVIGIYRYRRDAPYGPGHSLERLQPDRAVEPPTELLLR